MVSSFPSEFIHGDSTVNQLTYLYHIFCEALDSGKEARAVFFDISKAFDHVWHSGLLYKLEAAGVSREVKRYLSDILQRVVPTGVSSFWNYITAGVPQGSILGTLLFLLFISDIENGIGSNLRLFADDTCLFIIVENAPFAATCLNLDLDKITWWAATWLVTFNPSKTEALLLSRNLNTIQRPPLYMQNV